MLADVCSPTDARRRSLCRCTLAVHACRRTLPDARLPTRSPTLARRRTLPDAGSPTHARRRTLADAHSPTLARRRKLPDAGSPSVEDVISFGLIGGGNDFGLGLSLSLFRLAAWRFRRWRVQRLIIRFEGVRAVLRRQHVEIDFGLFVRFEFGTFQFRANIPLSPRHFSCFCFLLSIFFRLLVSFVFFLLLIVFFLLSLL